MPSKLGRHPCWVACLLVLYVSLLKTHKNLQNITINTDTDFREKSKPYFVDIDCRNERQMLFCRNVNAV